MYLEKIKSWYPNIVLTSIVLFASLLMAYLMSHAGVIVAPLVIFGLIGLFIVILIIKDFKIGYYLLLFHGSFMFVLERLITVPIPQGIVYDGMAALTFIAVFVKSKEKRDWTSFNNPVTIAFAIITIYQLLQIFNPSAVSPIAWLVSMRNNTSFLLYIVCFQMFATLKEVHRFTMIYVIVSLIIGVYGIYQEIFGLTGFEQRWMAADPDRHQLYFIWGRMRKFSLLSDPSSFGIFMSLASLSCLILAMGPFKTSKKIFFGISFLLTLVSMSFSGTRTAMAMTFVGVLFYIILTIRNRKTIIATMAIVFFGAVLFFGPFYGGTMNRIRSTFNPEDDPSMIVRDVKRIALQSYIHKHPFGGGVYTTGQNGVRYSAGHELAGGWDPDSGFLLTALELGWIGLFIFELFLFITVVKGVKNYYSMKDDPMLQTLTLAYVVPFLAITVAHFTQDAIFQKPINSIVIATYAIVVRLPLFQKKLYSVDLV